MKLAILLSALAGASAFAPASHSVTSQTQLNAADLETLRGVGPETGNEVVSRVFLPFRHWSHVNFVDGDDKGMSCIRLQCVLNHRLLSVQFSF